MTLGFWASLCDPSLQCHDAIPQSFASRRATSMVSGVMVQMPVSQNNEREREREREHERMLVSSCVETMHDAARRKSVAVAWNCREKQRQLMAEAAHL